MITLTFEEAKDLGEKIARSMAHLQWNEDQVHKFSLGIAYAYGLDAKNLLYHANRNTNRGERSVSAEVSDFMGRAAAMQPNPYAWTVTLTQATGTVEVVATSEDLGTPYYVTTWVGEKILSRESYGSFTEAKVRATVLRNRIAEARSAFSTARSEEWKS